MGDRPDFAAARPGGGNGFADAAREPGCGGSSTWAGCIPTTRSCLRTWRPGWRSGGSCLDSGVPTAVLQAAVVLGNGSASFDMLRYLTRRLPAMVAPKWLNSRIQPIAVDDVAEPARRRGDLPATSTGPSTSAGPR